HHVRQHAVQLLPRRPGDLLQADAGRAVPLVERPVQGLRHGGGGDRQAVAPPVPPVRGTDQLPGPYPRRRQENHLAGRRRGAVDPRPRTGPQTPRGLIMRLNAVRPLPEPLTYGTEKARSTPIPAAYHVGY